MEHKQNTVYLAGPLALSFPNASRSYDEVNRGVWFWGYDRTIEVAFYIDDTALAKICSDTSLHEANILATFDASLEHIREVAVGIYSRRRKAAHNFLFALTDTDFSKGQESPSPASEQ